jgi:hypothetical protein
MLELLIFIFYVPLVSICLVWPLGQRLRIQTRADTPSVPSGETSGTAVPPAQPNRVLWNSEENSTGSVERQVKYLEREMFEGSLKG